MLFRKQKPVPGRTRHRIKRHQGRGAQGQRGRGFKVVGFGVEPVPSNSIVDGAIIDGAAVADAIRRVFECQRHQDATDVAASLSGNAVIPWSRTSPCRP